MLYICIDGTGVPMIPAETEGRPGKGEDGRARTREVKLCCVFTQTSLDKADRPVRDPASSSYADERRALAELLDRWHARLVRHPAERRMAVRASQQRAARLPASEGGPAAEVIDLPTRRGTRPCARDTQSRRPEARG